MSQRGAHFERAGTHFDSDNRLKDTTDWSFCSKRCVFSETDVVFATPNERNAQDARRFTHVVRERASFPGDRGSPTRLPFARDAVQARGLTKLVSHPIIL